MGESRSDRERRVERESMARLLDVGMRKEKGKVSLMNREIGSS